MLELAFSQTNRERLQEIVQQAPPKETPGAPYWPTEAAQSLTGVTDEKERHEAVLRLVAILLLQPRRYELEQVEAAYDLIRALLEMARPLSHAADDSYGTHALIAELVLAALELLSRWDVDLLHSQALVLIAAYTDVNDPWTTQSASGLATNLLASSLSVDKLGPFIVGPVLQGYVRPIFQFRGTVNPLGSGWGVRHSIAERSHWKERDPLVMSVFRWAVDNANTSLIAGSWPLFLPVLLGFIEVQEISVKEDGLRILIKFLQKCPSEILPLTGLGTIFEDAVFPTLLYIPTSAEAQGYVNILSLACDVILQLAKKNGDYPHKQRRQLDRLIRRGILGGQLSTSTHGVVIETLMHCLTATVEYLGIYATEHFQILIQNIHPIMTDPFAVVRLSTIIASGKALNSVLRACWPRLTLAMNTEQVFRTISICWVNLHDQASAAAMEDLAAVRKQLLTSSTLLRSIWQGRLPEQIQHKLDESWSREPRLWPLLCDTPHCQKD